MKKPFFVYLFIISNSLANVCDTPLFPDVEEIVEYVTPGNCLKLEMTESANIVPPDYKKLCE